MSSNGGLKAFKDVALQGLWLGSMRGMDGTGIALIPKSKEERPEVYKKAMNGADFSQLNKTHRLVDKIGGSDGIIAHNRSWTRGTAHDNNSHPFQHGHITLVHNGTVTNYHSLSKNFKGVVDSDGIAHALAEREPEDVLPDLDGGFSLVWWDSRDKSLHFARNDQKPMWWHWSHDKKVLIYASEYEMIWWMARRNAIKLDDTVYWTTPMNHYIFNNSSASEVADVRPFQRKITVFTPRGRDSTNGTNASAPPWKSGGGWPDRPGRDASNSPRSKNLSTEHDQAVRRVLQTCGNLNRAMELVRLAQIRNLHISGKLACVPKKWIPYKDNKQRKGMIECMHKSTGQVILLHSYTEKQFNELYKKNTIWTWVTNYVSTTAHKGAAPLVKFIGILDRVTAQDMKSTDVSYYDEAKGSKSDVADEGELLPGPDGMKLNLIGWMGMTNKGCAQCCERVVKTEAPKVIWLEGTGNIDDHLCPSCANSPSVIKDWEGFLPKEFVPLWKIPDNIEVPIQTETKH